MQDADAQVSKKISGGTSSPGLTRLGSALAQRMPQTDTQNSSMTASKGPTVMEVHMLTYRSVPRTVSNGVQSVKSLASPPRHRSLVLALPAWPHTS